MSIAKKEHIQQHSNSLNESQSLPASFVEGSAEKCPRFHVSQGDDPSPRKGKCKLASWPHS